MEQRTLFYAVCHCSTGKELAQFVFDKLKHYDAPFEKLTSVATDGAKNMIGAENGMIPNLRRLVKKKLDPAPPLSKTCGVLHTV